ncbi:hypothetical protein V8F20_004279 [Naviculisporaceae sp. PSN 640]
MVSFKSLATLAATMAMTGLTLAAPAPATPSASAAPEAAAPAPVETEVDAAPVVAAGNISELDDEVVAMTPLGTTVVACEHPEWQGYCWYPWIGNSNCYNVPDWFDNQISSIRNANSGAYYCEWFEHYDCTGRHYDNQNDAKLQDGNGFFDDRISSLRCYFRGPGGNMYYF